MRIWVILVLLLCVEVGFADQEATTAEGRKVLLRDNGTWEYVEVSEQVPLSIADWNVAKMPVDYEKKRHSEEAWLLLIVKNETNAPVKGWRVVLQAKNAFGDTLGKLQLTGGQSKIGPGETTDAMFAFEDNPFIAGEPFDYLTSYDKDTMTIELADAKVIH